MRANPLVVEVARGLVAPGNPQAAVLSALLLPAVVLLLWWPKSELIVVLQSDDAPDTLLAVLIALGASTVWHAVRDGAEEILLPGQHGLQEWVLAAEVSVVRALLGSLAGYLLRLFQLLVFASPLVVMSFAVSGGEWSALGLGLLAVVLQAVFYRLLATLVYLRIGHHATATFLAVRALLPVGYLAAALASPSLSHPALSSHLMDGGYSLRWSTDAPDPLLFALGYMGVSALVALAVFRTLARARRE